MSHPETSSAYPAVSTVLRRHPLWWDASAQSMHSLDSAGRFDELRAGQCLVVANGDSGTVHLLIEGVVRVYHPAPKQGGEPTTRLIRGPALIGDAESALHCGWTATVQALTRVVTVGFPAEVYFQTLQRDARACSRHYQESLRRLGMTYQYERCLSTGAAAKERLIALLLGYAQQFGREIPEGTLIDHPLTQFDLAEQSATNRREVVRCLGTFYQAGAIRRLGRQYVLVDRSKLLELSKVEIPDISMGAEPALEGN